MTSLQKLTLAVLLACLFMHALTARQLPQEQSSVAEQRHSLLLFNHAAQATLEERLQSSGFLLAAASGGGGGGLMECWDALMQLRSCTNEMVLFFLNGESYLTLDCCRAIRIITRSCWPPMLNSLGFTAEEGDVLRGYCDAEVAAAPPPYAAAPFLLPQPPAGLEPAV